MRVRIFGVLLVGALGGVALVSAQAPTGRNMVLVTLDGARWQEIFTGMDQSLLRAATPKETDITTLPVFKQFSGSDARERREKLMPFLWTTLAVNHGFIAGNRANGSVVSVTNRPSLSYPGY